MKNRTIFITEPESRIATLIHPVATIGKDVIIGEGTAVMAGTVVNLGTKIGEGCIIYTSSSVDHDCIVGNYSHVGVGAHLCGNVTMGIESGLDPVRL